jgi:hypothetical protein
MSRIPAGRKTVTLPDFLTGSEIAKASKLYKECQYRRVPFAPECERQIILPVINRINAELGQENDPRFLAYAVEYVLSTVGER